MLEKLFKDNLEKLSIFRQDHKILLAVSGGVDSMVMANLFLRFKFDIAIVHCNFSLRGTASDGDAAFVEAFAKANNLPFYLQKFDTIKYAKTNNISIEMAARQLRYAWFEQLRDTHNFSFVATAHNLNDVAETFFLNLLRGTGINGLCGIVDKTDTLIRPLLFAPREQIESYAHENNIQFRVDASNASDEFLRNRIRHKIIPELESINPSFLQTMQSNCNYLLQTKEALQSYTHSILPDIVSVDNDKITIDILRLRQTANAQFLLFEILKNYGFNSSNIDGIANVLDSESGKVFYSPEYVLLKDRNRLIILKIEECENDFYSVEINEDLRSISYPIKLSFEKLENKNIEIDKSRNVAYLNFDKLEFPLVLRLWQPGDSFVPLGMRGRKKLSDYFVDAKLSKFDKNKQYVLLSDNKIVWLVNHRIDNAFKIDDTCTSILKISLEV